MAIFLAAATLAVAAGDVSRPDQRFAHAAGERTRKSSAKSKSNTLLKTASFTLKNGLTVYVHEDHSLPTVAVVTWFRVGSKDEVVGRTGFAHLFEHLMFKGSKHIPDGKLDVLLESAGGWSNAFTSSDMTVYLNVAQSNFLETALWIDADRLAGLVDTMDQNKLDNQRDVVRNERRQSYENVPYGMAEILNLAALWPAGFGYHWSTIGEHADLIAAKLPDVTEFFHRYYVPSNATMVIAGDVEFSRVKTLCERYFEWIPGGSTPSRPTYAEPPPIEKEIRIAAEDDVEVPQVQMTWRGPKVYSAGEPAMELLSEILAGSKSSRLYRRLIYTTPLAQEVTARFLGEELGGTFQIVTTARPGVSAERLEAEIDAELFALTKEGVSKEELERAKSVREAAFLHGLEPLVDRAVQIAGYAVQAGDANYLVRDLQRYQAVTPAEIQAAARDWLRATGRVVLTFSPKKKALAQGGKQ